MAKRRRGTKAATRTIVRQVRSTPAPMVVAGPGFLSRTQAAIQRSGPRLGGRIKQAAIAERHTLIAVGSAAALGLAESRGVALPKIDALGTAGTYGLLAFGYAKLTGSMTAEKIATGLLSVAAYKLASAPTGSTPEGEGGELP